MSQSRSFIGTGKHEFQPSQSRIGANAPKNGAERTAKFSTALPNWPKACRELDEALLKTPFFSHAEALRGK
jgi:hypothetical protein